MADFINIKQEIRWGDWYFRDHVADPAFDYKVHKKECSEYYRTRKFFASMMFSDYYSRTSGIQSEQYMPMDVYFFYALPCLNRWDLRIAYTDKNIYSIIFRNVAQPQTVVKNINGIFYDCEEHMISHDEAVMLVVSAFHMGGLIIKPTLDTCNGIGVKLLDGSDSNLVNKQFAEYNINYIVQYKVQQHSEMARLNHSSLNTLRMFTYRDIDGKVHYLKKKTFIRFGGKGAIMDNGSAGGGICKVNEDGIVDDAVHRFKKLKTDSLAKNYGISEIRVPSFGKAIELVVSLHEKLSYFDYIGWDVAIGETGIPIFIEHNVLPSVEGPQLISGPVFGEYLDEVMERISVVRKEKRVYTANYFRSGFNYLLPIG